MDNDKNRKLIKIANVFTAFAFIYLVYSLGDLAYSYIASMNANPDLSIHQIFRWNSFISQIANISFRVFVLFGISAILHSLIKD